MSSTVQVYSAGFSDVVTIPRRAVHQMPQDGVSRLVLCGNYDASKGSRSCPMGSRCKFVHADVRRATRHAVHVNYAWRRVQDVTYERYEAGQTLRVAPPNSKSMLDTMDSELVLRTRALASKRRPLSHCAHFYFNRTCNLGADCQFIHAVFIDPTAKDHQRAPVPSQLGEGRETLLSKKQREAKQREAASTRPEGTATPPPHTQQALVLEHHAMPITADITARDHKRTPSVSTHGSDSHTDALVSCESGCSLDTHHGGAPTPSSDAGFDRAAAATSATTSPSDSFGLVGRVLATPDTDAGHLIGASCALHGPSGQASTPSGSTSSAPRFRHDPYSARASRVIVFST